MFEFLKWHVVLNPVCLHVYCQCAVPYRHIPARLDSFKPDLVVYNAGTDILLGDPLGNLDITPEVGGLDILSFTRF